MVLKVSVTAAPKSTPGLNGSPKDLLSRQQACHDSRINDKRVSSERISFFASPRMAPAVDQPGMSAYEAAAINAAAVTRNYSVKPRLQYQTVSAVSGN